MLDEELTPIKWGLSKVAEKKLPTELGIEFIDEEEKPLDPQIPDSHMGDSFDLFEQIVGKVESRTLDTDESKSIDVREYDIESASNDWAHPSEDDIRKEAYLDGFVAGQEQERQRLDGVIERLESKLIDCRPSMATDVEDAILDFTKKMANIVCGALYVDNIELIVTSKVKDFIKSLGFSSKAVSVVLSEDDFSLLMESGVDCDQGDFKFVGDPNAEAGAILVKVTGSGCEAQGEMNILSSLSDALKSV